MPEEEGATENESSDGMSNQAWRRASNGDVKANGGVRAGMVDEERGCRVWVERKIKWVGMWVRG
jgi:hypothetical protein